MSNDPQKVDLKKVQVRGRSNRLRMMGAKVPDDLYRALAMWACDNNVSKSEAIRIAVNVLTSPANRKEELFDRLEAIEQKLDAIDAQTKQIDVVRELVASLAKYVFFYAVQPSDRDESKKNMEARFDRFIKMAAKRVLAKASQFEMREQEEDNGGFL